MMKRINNHGVGNIGQQLDFGVTWQMVRMVCHFKRIAGASAAASANLTLDWEPYASRENNVTYYNTRLWTVESVGVDASDGCLDAYLAIEAQYADAWTFCPMDWVWINWTNPSAGNIAWGLDVMYKELTG